MSGKAMKAVMEDPLRSLPDDILVNILSRLSLNSSVKCTILSKQWYCDGLWRVWPSMTCIDAEILYDSLHSLQFWAFLDNAICKFTAPSITRFQLNLFHRMLEETKCWSILDALFRRFSERGIEEISVTSHGYRVLEPIIPLHSTCVFEISTLVSLELGSIGGLAWRLPSSSAINLPKLKKLTIYARPIAMLDRLVSSCPSLENLSFTIGEIEHNSDPISISAQNLRRLSACLYRFNNRLVIDAPRLEHLTFDGINSSIIFANDPILLLEVDIQVLWRQPMTSTELLKIFNSVSHIKTLKLETSNVPLYILMRRFSETLVFTKLTCLTLSIRCARDFNPLLNLVQLCSALEKMVVRFEIYHRDELFPTPEYVLPNVKMIDVWTFEINSRRHMLDFLAKMLGSVPNLEELVVNDTSCESMSSDGYRLQFAQRLSESTRKSSKCRIKLRGRYLE